MKLSKLLHVGSVIAGLIGVVTFAASIIGGDDNLVFGVTKIDSLLCSAILILMAIWFVLGAIHHTMLEKKERLYSSEN
jgi:preprotein translocase subunit SecG